MIAGSGDAALFVAAGQRRDSSAFAACGPRPALAGVALPRTPTPDPSACPDATHEHIPAAPCLEAPPGLRAAGISEESSHASTRRAGGVSPRPELDCSFSVLAVVDCPAGRRSARRPASPMRSRARRADRLIVAGLRRRWRDSVRGRHSRRKRAAMGAVVDFLVPNRFEFLGYGSDAWGSSPPLPERQRRPLINHRRTTASPVVASPPRTQGGHRRAHHRPSPPRRPASRPPQWIVDPEPAGVRLSRASTWPGWALCSIC